MRSLKLVFTAVALATLMLLSTFTMVSIAQPGAKGKADCRYRDLETNKLIHYGCDRFQSKGDIDEVTPQLKIISPEPDDVIDYSTLTDSNGNGFVELPIRIVISPDSDYTVDFTAATSAATEYGFQPQIAGLGHAHAYIAPGIEVTKDVSGNVTDVDFVGSENRSDNVGGFCVFREPLVMDTKFQVLETNCDLFQFVEPIVSAKEYRVIVDTTQNSHDARIKQHPRDVPPGDQVIITFSNVPVPAP